jgi:hypothetical protein
MEAAMATNIVRYLDEHWAYPVVVTNPTTPTSGAPVRFGSQTGIALTDEGEGGNAATATTVNFGPYIADHVVDDDAGSGIAVGDAIFYHDTPTGSPATNLNNASASGYFYGFAMETVGANATATIEVCHVPSPGAGTLGAGTVGESNLASAAVAVEKLKGALQTGFIPVPLTSLREVFSNAITNIAGNGGVLASDTTPVLNFTNGDTDSALRVLWAATNVDPVIFQVPLPPDLDEASNVEVHFRAAMEGATDTPVISADSYFNEGDTKVEDDSAAVTGTTYAEYIITIAAADVPAGAQTMTVELTPGAHGDDDLYMTAVWVEYQRTD